MNSHLAKTCWVLEGAGFEEPEPMLLEVMENRAWDAKPAQKLTRTTVKARRTDVY